MTIEEIAAQLGISKSAIGRAVAGMKIDRRDAANKTRANVKPPWLGEARKLFDAGVSRPKIAVKLNVGQTTIYRVLDKFRS